MTRNKIASQLAKAEGKKKQVAIGDIREILKLLVRQHVAFLKGTEESSYLTSLTIEAVEAYRDELG